MIYSCPESNPAPKLNPNSERLSHTIVPKSPNIRVYQCSSEVPNKVGGIMIDWKYSTIHKSACKVVDEQTLWGQTVYRVWLPNQDAVVRVPQSDLQQDREQCAVYGISEEPDLPAAEKLRSHPLPHRIEQMITQYL